MFVPRRPELLSQLYRTFLSFAMMAAETIKKLRIGRSAAPSAGLSNSMVLLALRLPPTPGHHCRHANGAQFLARLSDQHPDDAKRWRFCFNVNASAMRPSGRELQRSVPNLFDHAYEIVTEPTRVGPFATALANRFTFCSNRTQKRVPLGQGLNRVKHSHSAREAPLLGVR
jgi:hypothetical protein